MIKENFVIRTGRYRRTAQQHDQSRTVRYWFFSSFTPSCCDSCEICLETMGSHEGSNQCPEEAVSIKGIHILPCLLARIYIWTDSHCTPGCVIISLLSGNPAAKLHLQRCSGLNEHTPTLPKPSSHCHLALHKPASFPLPSYFLTEPPPHSQHVNNVKKTVPFVFN